MKQASLRSLLLILALAAVTSLPCLAATYRLPSDETLIRKTDVIVRGRVESVVSVPSPVGDGIDTEIAVAVDRVLKGTVGARSVVVRQPGGRLGDRIEIYPGIGSFATGEEVILMLDEIRGGQYRMTDFAVGKFTVRIAPDGTEYLRRDGLREASVLDGGTSAATSGAGAETNPSRPIDPDRDAAAFERYIAVVLQGDRARPDYVLPEVREGAGQGIANFRPEFSLLGTPPSRWLEFDTGGTVTIVDNPTGDAGSNCPTGCHAEVAAGVQAWNVAAGTIIRLAYGGTDPNIGTMCRSALSNQIQFNDPCNEITDLSSCSGTLGVGGFTAWVGNYWTGCAAQGNPSFNKISKARILVNNGVGSCLNTCNYTDFIAHETGHMIGAGHSAVGSALMLPTLVNGRCAALQPDDEAFAQCVYAGQAALSCAISAFPSSGPAPLNVSFQSGRGGGDAPFTFAWDFDDGGTADVESPSHTFLSAGSYDVELTVTDDSANSCTDSIAICASTYPVPVVTSASARKVDGIWRAVVLGSGFRKGSTVQIDAGTGYVSAPKTVFKKRTKVVGKPIDAIWPVGVPVSVRVLSPSGCAGNAVAATR